MTTPTVTWDGPGQLEVDAVSLQAPAITTSANVTVGGRVVTANGAGIPKAAVSMDDGTGNTRTVHTNPFGYYIFDEVAAGRTYVISISDKRYQFVNPTRIVTIDDSVTDLDFTALP